MIGVYGFLIGLLMVVTPACPVEDHVPSVGQMCHWDADKQGNGIGHSFIAIRDDVETIGYWYFDDMVRVPADRVTTSE